MPRPHRTKQPKEDLAKKSLAEMISELQTKYQNYSYSSIDNFVLGQIMAAQQAFLELCQKLYTNPVKLASAQLNYNLELLKLYQNHILTLSKNDQQSQKSMEEDKRFKNVIWQEQPFFRFLKQFFLLTAKHILLLANEIDTETNKSARSVSFYMKQIVDALSPTNFFITNPDVLRQYAETEGQSLLRGTINLLHDIERGKGRLNISMTDTDAFQIGKNVAVTPGQVVYQNDIMQLIQYKPATATVYQNPILIIPPMINKFYILDLSPRNSLVKWLVEQGYTVFLISWVNPSKQLWAKDFKDYMLEGPNTALGVIEQITKINKINVLGFCIGGTLLAFMLAYHAVQGDTRVQSATYLTTLLDFAEPGDLGIFIDEQQLQALEKHVAIEGYLNGNIFTLIFNLLRPNDLIWPYYVKNYMQGHKPPPIDLLYWNADPTNLPAQLTLTYLREMYQQNRLKVSGGMMCNTTPIAINNIKIPVYFLSNQNDHIAPWKSTYVGTSLHSGPVTFVLGGAGHIAGVVNPPVNEKYSYFTNNKLYKTPEKWLATAKQHPGSWWPHWEKWLRKNSGKKIKARKPGSNVFKPIEDAPGSYVLVKLSY